MRARPIRARDDQCGARACFPSSDVSGGEGKKPFRSSGRGLQRRFRDSCFLDLRASAKSARRILNRELIFFCLLRRSAARLKRTQTRAEKTKKGAANLPLLPVGVNRLGRYFEKRRTTARASGHSSRRANGGFRTAKRAARGFASLGGGSTREKVRISVASARTPRAPSRNRRVSEDARFFSFRAVPRFAATAIRRRARAAGATKAPRRGASRATLMHAR